MRAKRQRPWKPDFSSLLVDNAELAALVEKQQRGELFHSNAILPTSMREPAPALGVVPYWQTDLNVEAASCKFPAVEEEDLLELSDKSSGQGLTVPVNRAAHDRNGFLPDENKLILEARAVNVSFEDISGQLLHAKSTAAVKRQFKYLRSTATVPEQMQMALPMSSEPEAAPEHVHSASTSTGPRVVAEVNRYVVHRPQGDTGVVLKITLPQPPKGFTGMAAHGLTTLAGVSFFEEVDIPDPDDPGRVFTFSLQVPNRGPCFNIGTGPDGSPLLSWSDLHAIYMLPDGTKWAEHGYFYDMDDLEAMARTSGKSVDTLLQGRTLEPQELVKNKNRYHTRLVNIEYECWVYKDTVNELWLKEDGTIHQDAYFWTICFDPTTMREVSPH